jgi:hypothetical protein
MQKELPIDGPGFVSNAPRVPGAPGAAPAPRPFMPEPLRDDPSGEPLRQGRPFMQEPLPDDGPGWGSPAPRPYMQEPLNDDEEAFMPEWVGAAGAPGGARQEEAPPPPADGELAPTGFEHLSDEELMARLSVFRAQADSDAARAMAAAEAAAAAEAEEEELRAQLPEAAAPQTLEPFPVRPQTLEPFPVEPAAPREPAQPPAEIAVRARVEAPFGQGASGVEMGRGGAEGRRGRFGADNVSTLNREMESYVKEQMQVCVRLPAAAAAAAAVC